MHYTEGMAEKQVFGFLSTIDHKWRVRQEIDESEDAFKVTDMHMFQINNVKNS